MKRDKNGRFKKNPKFEIEFPPPKSIIKYIFILIILLPWIYLMIFKYDIVHMLEIGLSKLFDLEMQECQQKTPY